MAIYTPEGTALERKTPSDEMKQMNAIRDQNDSSIFLNPLQCTLAPFLAPVSYSSLAYYQLEAGDEAHELLNDWHWGEGDHGWAGNQARDDGEDPNCHRIGGWPTPIQNEMETDAALIDAGFYCGDGKAYKSNKAQPVLKTAKDWVLLTQIGYDEKIGEGWGDCGQLYFWIRRDHLVARDFSRVIFRLQCY